MIAVIPMMGIGDRFTKGGYTEYKPLIRVNSEILIKKVVKPLIGKFKSIYIICNPSISKQIGSIFDDEVQIIELIENTRGAAETLLKSCAYFEENEQIVCVDCDTIFHDSAIQKITEIGALMEIAVKTGNGEEVRQHVAELEWFLARVEVVYA